jgi:hypothetical protein
MVILKSHLLAYAHPRIMKAHEDFLPWPVLKEQLQALMAAAMLEDETGIRAVLHECVQGFHEQPF